ncbi:MAG: hypothetical protein HY549_08585 [Elusimicrobia bacterium]|nr:hypothetical protein [Elusimicrobiota bacterium]
MIDKKLFALGGAAVAGVLVSSLLLSSLRAGDALAGEAKTAADLEKEKAMKNPYPNDLGPEKIDEEIKDYPADKKEGYQLLLARCAQCHSAARPLHSRFVEPEMEVAKLKSAQPEVFKDGAVWQVEDKIWNRYVKRMMNKPGCKISQVEGKKIWQFLVYDSNKRKIGANAKKWEAHRRKLLADFKAKYPQRYEELAKDKDL